MITGCKDIDYQILLLLSDRDLFMMFQVNKYYKNIEDDEDFWRMRISEKINPYFNKSLLEPNIESYKKAFVNVVHTIFTLNNFDNLDKSPIKNGDIIEFSNDIYLAKDDKLNKIQYVRNQGTFLLQNDRYFASNDKLIKIIPNPNGTVGPTGPTSKESRNDIYVCFDKTIFNNTEEIGKYDYLYRYIAKKNNSSKINIFWEKILYKTLYKKI